MRRFGIILSLLFLFMSCQKQFDALNDRIDKVEDRLLELESLCKSMNSNISSLQTLVSAMENNNFIKDIHPIVEGGKTLGYKISFAKGDSITIYNGADGKDGQNGIDGLNGKDGYTPQIGVKADSDGVYYWTLDGEWLLDKSGNKIPTTGKDGTDGKDGVDGKDGQDGQDGKDGVDGKDGHTPVIGVKQDTDGKYYWTVDGEWIIDHNGNKIPTTGGDGVQGADGKDGVDGYTPEIGVMFDSDGVFYWTIDGKWLLDPYGKRIPTTGQNGKDGENGANGENGIDGITPLFKIENDYWFVSYDNGETWTSLGESKGEKGDSFFLSVTTDSKYVYFVLADGTTLTVPKVSDVIDNIKSISYIPRYADGKAVMINTPSKQFSFVELDLAVSPKEVINSLTIDMIKVTALDMITRSVTYIDLPVLSFTADPLVGVVTIKASGKDLSDAFFDGNSELRVAAHITDGNYDFATDYIPMVSPKRISHPYERSTKLVAHRGFWNTPGSAQNSITALRKANEIKIWGCEVDIWETGDNVLVVNHDPTINGVSIQDSPYSAIKDFALSNGEKLPTFEQYLSVFKNECPNLILVVEIKSHSNNLKTISATRNAISMIRRMGLEDRVEYISFSPVAGDAVVKYAPSARFAYLDESMNPLQCAERGYTGLDYHYTIYEKNPAWASEALRYNLELFTWNIWDQSLASKMKGMGITVATTDQPDKAKAWYMQSENINNTTGENSNVVYE